MNNKMTFRFNDNDSSSRKRVMERSLKEQPKESPLDFQSAEEARAEEQPILIKDWATQALQHNADEPKLKEKAPLIDGQPLNLYTNDYGGWQSSFDTETNRVERLIRESGERRSAETNGRSLQPGPSHEPYRLDDQYRNDEPEEPLRDHRWYVPEDPVYLTHPRKPSPSWIKIATSVAGAVVTGLAFGFFVLSMFSTDSGDKADGKNALTPGQNTAALNTPAPKPGDKTAATTGGTASGAAAPVTAQSGTAATSAVSIPAKSFSFLQSGVFSTAQSADNAVADLKKKGYYGVRDSGDKYPVYVGMSMTRDEALGLTQQFKQNNIEVIVKNIELPAVSKIKWNGKSSDALPNYMNQGDKLLQAIVPLTVGRLSESKPAAIDAAALQSVKTAHQAWTGLAAAANEGLAEDARAAVQKMNQAMNTAIVSLDEYKKNASASIMWQAQSSLMQYVLAEKELRKAVSAS